MTRKAKAAAARPWTATNLHKLRGFVKNNKNIVEIARKLKRTPAAVAAKARLLGLSLIP